MVSVSSVFVVSVSEEDVVGGDSVDSVDSVVSVVGVESVVSVSVDAVSVDSVMEETVVSAEPVVTSTDSVVSEPDVAPLDSIVVTELSVTRDSLSALLIDSAVVPLEVAEESVDEVPEQLANTCSNTDFESNQYIEINATHIVIITKKKINKTYCRILWSQPMLESFLLYQSTHL